MVVTIFPNDLMQKGLKLLGYKFNDKVCAKTWEDRFRGHYGSNPIVYSKIFSDLQTTTNVDARVDVNELSSDLSIKYFLMSLYYLRCNSSELQLSALFQLSERTVRKWTWFYITKIHHLKTEKIIWPENWVENFIITVDGTHCRIEEPKHATLSQDKSYYSHKMHEPAVNYEIGLSIFQNKCVWVNGPFPAGTNDIQVFRKPNGLKSLIPNGKKVVGDEGYRGDIVSTSNPEDTDEVKKFKRRAKSRHETFNAKIKTFRSISECFNRSLHRHKSVFEAICVIVQYQLENGSMLYEV